MEIKNILFLSQSVVFRKIVKSVLAGLVPSANICDVSEEHAIFSALPSSSFELVIIDDAIRESLPASVSERIFFLCRKIRRVVLCSQKDFNKRDNPADIHYIVKPIELGYEQNVKTIKSGLRAVILQIQAGDNGESNAKPTAVKSEQKVSLVLLAASTGGPRAIEQILSQIPPLFGVPMLIVQHMPAGFTLNFAAHINKQLSMDAVEASDGDSLQGSRIFIAPGGFQMKVNTEKKIVIRDEPPVNGVRPSADVLFSSVARAFEGQRVLVIILTGMGVDGTEGVRKLKQYCECFCVTQAEKECIVYGMPRAVAEAGLSNASLTIDGIAELIKNL